MDLCPVVFPLTVAPVASGKQLAVNSMAVELSALEG